MSSKFPAVTSGEVINVLQKIGFRFNASPEAVMQFITGILTSEGQMSLSIRAKY